MEGYKNMQMLRKYWQGTRMWVEVGLLLLLLVASSISTFALKAHQTKASQFDATAGGWPTYMANNRRSGFNGTETLINSTTAANLKVHWTFKGGGMIFSQPVIANGMVYWGSWDGYEHATDLNGEPVWRQNLGQTTANCGTTAPYGVISTAAVASVSINGTKTLLVVVGGGDDHLYALNASTGAIIWRTPLGAPSSNTFIWDSPVVYNGSVYIGTASIGDCPLIPGQLLRIDASTGSIQNTFNVVPGGCIGGGIWSSPTIDQVNNSVYFTTGTAGRCPTSEKNAIAMVKLNASNLSFISSWHIPKSERVLDSDFGATPTLFQAPIGGSTHQLVGAANKNGVYYAFDRTDIGSGPLWRAQIAVGGACPQCGKGSISSSAWDGTMLYVAGGNTTINGNNCKGSLRALDPSTGHFIWEHCLNEGTVLGAVTVVPGVVAAVEGPDLVLVDATSGKALFAYRGLSVKSHFYGSPSISNGVLYIGNKDSRLYALGT